MDTPMPEAVKKLVVLNVNDVEHVASTVDFVFSAVDMSKDEIKKIEEAYAKTETPVVSNNSAHRWTPDVPMVVPEINAEHFEVIKDQKKRLGTTRGFVAVKPNCSIQSYAPCLAAWKEFDQKSWLLQPIRQFQEQVRRSKTGRRWWKYHSLYRWRRGKKSEQGAASSTRQSRKRTDRESRTSKDYLSVYPCSGSGRTYSSRIHQL